MSGPVDPVEVFTGLAARHDRIFWLDGGGSRPWSGRRSILGALREEDASLVYDATARTVTRHRHGRADVVGDDPFAVLEEHLAHERGDPSVSWVGYFGYAARPDLPAAPDPTGAPDAVWMRLRDPLVVEHPVAAPEAARSRAAPATGGPDEPRSEVPAGYAAAFAQVQAELRAGNTYEVNLTYREQLESAADPVATYLRLRELNPAPYAGFLRHGSTALLSSSPERYATVDRHRWLEAKPIKGTTPRGATAEEDAELAARLADDPKCRAENLMIVDLLRNDLSMVCAPGTVTVPALMQVESYRSVHQLVSTVRGRLRDDVTTVGALRALFPAGSMTGAPKLRTMEIIGRVEPGPRGVYAGAFGWIGGDGRADLGVVIRSLVCRGDDPPYRWTFGTGGGITVRSEVAEEYLESRWKAERLRAALVPPGRERDAAPPSWQSS